MNPNRFYQALIGVLVMVLFVGLGLDAAGRLTVVSPRDLLSLVYRETITPEELTVRYDERQLRVLLIPGHDNESGGAAFRGRSEADLNLRLAEELFRLLSANDHLTVFTARDFATGEYVPAIENYFAENRGEIVAAVEELKQEFAERVAAGEFRLADPSVHHNFALPEAAFRLHGLNAWANDQDIDLTLHLHLNDVPKRRSGEAGRYGGFAIYIPERQYGNARASAVLAQNIFDQLKKFFPVSNLPGEQAGIIEDQELIAVGPYGSRDGAAALIEYGYIYEPLFSRPELFDWAARELALQTYNGVMNYFDLAAARSATALLPYRFEDDLEFGDEGPAVLALQKALDEAGLYPPAGESPSDCPPSGLFRYCVREAVADFQARHGLAAVGRVGPETRAKLNELFGSEASK